MIEINKRLSGKKIQTQKGDVIKVILPENPTTGYLWKINSLDDKHLNYKENEYEISDEAVGAGGMKIFYIEVTNKGTSELRITLSKPWENYTLDSFNVIIET